MSYKDLPLNTLINQLSDGWQPAHCGLAQELVRRWETTFAAEAEIKSTEENSLFFMTGLTDICMRGIERLACFLFSGNSNITSVAQDLWRQASHLLTFVFALSDSAYQQLKRVSPEGRCLLLPAEQVKQLFKAGEPKQFLKSLLCKQIPRQRLVAYSFLLPAEGNMFFGRRKELDRLLKEDHISFAIAGPSRIGKTSIVKRYMHDLTKSRDPLGPSTFYINFYNCPDNSDSEAARFCAMRIENSRRSARMTVEDLVNFLWYKSSVLGNPLNLVLDEIDEHCQGKAFKALTSAARDGYCRLILCGRGVLLKTLLNSKSPMECRLDLIQPEPLDARSARDLVLRPLEDLCFSVEDAERVTDEVLRLTGRLPHLLHIYGHKLVELAIDEGVDTISIKHVETLKWDFMVAQYFINPLTELEDPEARAVGLSLLKSKGQDFSIPFVQKLAEQAGLNIDYARTTQICNELVINNVLIWHNGVFRIANEGLYFYASEMNFLDGAIKEAINKVKARS